MKKSDFYCTKLLITALVFGFALPPAKAQDQAEEQPDKAEIKHV